MANIPYDDAYPGIEFLPRSRNWWSWLKGTPAEYKAGLDYAIAKGWLVLHESGTYVRFTEAGASLFA